MPVHPRGRGEQNCQQVEQLDIGGSSPRTRGTGDNVTIENQKARFIPADAGNSTRQQTARPPPPVHPRGRGEQPPPPKNWLPYFGSSPRTRGTGILTDSNGGMFRFIPADAGNRQMRRTKAPHQTVHPRGRGEQSYMINDLDRATGSSPRTRGTGLPSWKALSRPRFIPADAGNRGRDF